MKSNDKLYTKDFTLVLIGQIISLFANSILGFAILLYLLNQTGSAAIYGTISAGSMIPALLLAPVGGILADRLNKKNIMVILDFTTTCVILLYTWMLGRIDLVTLTFLVLLIFSGVKAIYQPSVSASIPILVSKNNMIKANSAVNTVSSLVNLIAPSMGGVMYGIWGIYPLLYISAACFGISAVMEIFICIPNVTQQPKGNLFRTTFIDLKETLFYIKKKCPSIWHLALLVLALNGIIGALAGASYPVVITQWLEFEPDVANRLYGYMGSISAAGGLLGAFVSGKLLSKLKISNGSQLLIACSAPCVLTGFSLLLPSDMSMVIYVVLCICSFISTFLCAIISIQLLSCIQMLSPKHMIGKIMGCLSSISMCATPIGTAVYGVLLDILKNGIAFIFIGAFVGFALIAMKARGTFERVEKEIETDN